MAKLRDLLDDFFPYIGASSLILVLLSFGAVITLCQPVSDSKKVVDLTIRTADPAFVNWLSSNNYELVGVTVSSRGRATLELQRKEADVGARHEETK